MSDNKDFLNQFSNQGKPASFQEEERIPVTKQRKPLNVKLLIGLLIAAIVLGILAYFLFFAPKIEVPNFVGKTKNDVAAWTKQQGIEQSGILFDERYDFDTDEGIIISQSIPEGKKVKNNVKMDFVISLGADPEEKIKVPDIKNMNKDEIQNWVSQNKLAKTRVMTAYNDEVEENEVIDYSFSGCEEDTFTRGCSLRINISKGSAPAGKVTVEDFVKKMYESAEAWAKTKKVNLVKVEQYSSTVEKGYIISQSVESGKTLDEGADFVVTVSLGKAVTMPNMYEWTESQIRAWCSKNGVILNNVEERYDPEAKGECIGQSIKAGTLVKEGEYLDVVISLDDANVAEFIESHGGKVEETTVFELEQWKKEKNSKGANLNIVIKEYKPSDSVPLDHIISMTTKTHNSDTIEVVVSEGRNIMLIQKWNNVKTEEEARDVCDKNGVSCEFIYEKSEGDCNGTVKNIEGIKGNEKIKIEPGSYISQKVVVRITIVDNGKYVEKDSQGNPCIIPEASNNSDSSETGSSSESQSDQNN